MRRDGAGDGEVQRLLDRRDLNALVSQVAFGAEAHGMWRSLAARLLWESARPEH
jgi:hypothetical protein